MNKTQRQIWELQQQNPDLFRDIAMGKICVCTISLSSVNNLGRGFCQVVCMMHCGIEISHSQEINLVSLFLIAIVYSLEMFIKCVVLSSGVRIC